MISYTIHPECMAIFEEPAFEIFMHNGMLCCIQRHMSIGVLNGYVAVDKTHPLYRKSYNDKIIVPDVNKVQFNNNWIGAFCMNPLDTELNILPLDIALTVHGGLSYAHEDCPMIEEEVFPGRWWFGFDTAHSGDLQPLEMTFLKPLNIDWYKNGYTYKSIAYVRREVKKLAEQLAAFIPVKTDIQIAAENYYIHRK